MVDYAESIRSCVYWVEKSIDWGDKPVEIKRNSRRIFKLVLNTCVFKTNRGTDDELKSCFYLKLKETFG